MKNKTIGEQIKYHRIRVKLTQQQLAEQVGIADKTGIYKIESGDRNPSYKTLEKIADVLNCDVEIYLKQKK